MKPPMDFPYSYVFLTPEPGARAISAALADAISREYHWTFIDDINMPIHDALRAMFDLPFHLDLGLPDTNRLVDGQSYDTMFSLLLTSYNDKFPPPHLGARALRRALDAAAMNDYLFVYRDATLDQLSPFITRIPPRDRIIVPIKPTNDVPSLLKTLVEPNHVN